MSIPTTPLDALSPLDGRYAAKLAPVREIFSEAGLMRERVRVECAWFAALARGPAARALSALAPAARGWARGARRESEGDRRRRHQGHRGAHQTRREGRRVLDPRRARGARCRAGAARMGAFRLHLRGHQQSRLRAHAERGAWPTPRARRLEAHRRGARFARGALCRQPACWRARTDRRATPTTVGKELANVAARLRAPARRHRARSRSSAR